MAQARNFVARIGAREVPVRILPLGGGIYEISIDGMARVFDVRRIGERVVSLLVEGRHYEASVLRRGDDFDLLLGGRRYRFALLSELRARRTQRGSRTVAGRQEIKASMPGKVVEVLVSVGDRVEPEQGLLVVEAMKMENEIRSPGGGQVREIRVEPGQAVEAGELLVVVE
jgi:acetyl/propionyl-CoA carboxylase alpha subunit